jgi:hypothetical protein
VTDPRPPSEEPKEVAALSKEVSEFLLEFSIGVHKHSMYPPDHPSLLPTAENVLGRLSEVLADRENFTIGVGLDQLVVEGVATESRHPVLRELAKRLHDHHLGAISFYDGTLRSEVEGLLETIAQDPERGGDPLGLLPSEEIPNWDHIRLLPLGYDGLELTGEADPSGEGFDRATDLWLGLARSAMGVESDFRDPEKSPDGGTVAKAIRRSRKDAAYDEVIAGYLAQLAVELRSGEREEKGSIRRRVTSLVRELDPQTLERLVQMGGNPASRRRFVLDANQSLAVSSVVKIVEAAANASHQTISHSLTRLLTKLSSHASDGGEAIRGQADTALRENVEELVNDWDLKDPNPDDYTLILDSISRAAPSLGEGESEEPSDGLTGAQRLLQMSLELDSWGPTVAKAVADLTEGGEIGYLLRMAEEAPDGSQVGQRFTAFLASRSQLRRLLSGEDVPEEELVKIVGMMGMKAAPVLLDVLGETESRALRRKVFNVLQSLGDEVGPLILERLRDGRWYVIRNMLALARGLTRMPLGFSAYPFLEHEDPRVRREAFPSAVQEMAKRHRCLALGLADPDERILRMALLEAQEGLPESLVPVLVNRVLGSRVDSEMKALSLRALRHSQSALALETLLNAAGGGRSILGRIRLAESSEEVLAAIEVLARAWPHEPRAKKLLAAAKRRKDPRFQRALEGGGEV